MAEQDGSIIVDTEINSEGFKSGSEQLLAAIQSLTHEVQLLGEVIQKTFQGVGKTIAAPNDDAKQLGSTIAVLDAKSQALQATVDQLKAKLDSLSNVKEPALPVDQSKISDQEAKIRELESTIAQLRAQMQETAKQPITTESGLQETKADVAELENKVQELETTVAQLQSGNNEISIGNTGTASTKLSDLERQINTIGTSVDRLEPTFQRAMNGSSSAMTSVQTQVAQLSAKLSGLETQLSEFGQQRIPTQQYSDLVRALDTASVKAENLRAKQKELEALNIDHNSAQWKRLQYEMAQATAKLDAYNAKIAELEDSGASHITGSQTAAFQRMSDAVGDAQVRLESMQKSLRSLGGGSFLKKSVSALSSGIKKAVSGIASGIKSAAKGMVGLLKNSKAMNGQFGGLISGAKRFAVGLLGARGIWAILQKAVSVYMEQNKQLSNTLSSCWTSIGNLLGPIITKVINLVAQAVSYVTSFLKLFGAFGKAASSSITAAGTAASKESDKLQRQLASFDELNVLSDNSKDSKSGGKSDAAVPLPDVTLPDWAKLMVDQLKAGDWTAAATTLTTQLNSMVASVDWSGLGDKIGFYLNGALTFLATAVSTFDWYALGTNFADGINRIVQSVDWANLGVILGAKFSVLIKGLGGLFARLDWKALGLALSNSFMGLWRSIDWAQAGKMLSDGAIGLLRVLTTAIETTDWQQVGRDLATLLANIDWSGILSALCEGLGAALGGLAQLLWGLIQDAWNSVVDWWYDTAYEDGEFTITGLLEGIWNVIKNIGIWIYDHICKPFVDGFKAAFGIHSPSTVMAAQGQYITLGLLKGISGAWSSIIAFLGTGLQSITAKISTGWATLKSGTATAWNTIKTSVVSAWDNVKSKTQSVCASIASTAAEKFASLHKSVSDKVSAVKTVVRAGFDKVKSDITSKMAAAMKDVGAQNWLSIGSNICSGISSGINKGWNALKSTITKLGSNLLNAAKKVLDIHSPSRVFRDEVGLNIGYGVGEGVEASQPSILRSVSGVADAIADEFQNGRYTVGGIVPESEVDHALTAFSDKISGSFERLLDRLQSIADGASYRVPTATSGIVPYKTSAQASMAESNLGAAIEASNDTLADVIIQSVTNATTAVVSAIERYSGTTVNLDTDSLASGVISEINRKTRMLGKSPLLV